MKHIVRKFLFIAAALCVSPIALCGDLPGEWLLHVQNPEHQVVAALKVQFTGERAESCMSGDWKVVRVVSATSKVKGFFPISDPLAYRIEGGQLTIGRNQVCDAYLWLQGSLGKPSVKGDYFSLGLGGSSPLGYFTLSHSE
jgi:hypothetical protein